jgi:hypothetical protein
MKLTLNYKVTLGLIAMFMFSGAVPDRGSIDVWPEQRWRTVSRTDWKFSLEQSSLYIPDWKVTLIIIDVRLGPFSGQIVGTRSSMALATAAVAVGLLFLAAVFLSIKRANASTA